MLSYKESAILILKPERMLIQRVLTIYYMKTKDISQNNLKTAWTFWHIPLLHISQTPPWNSEGLGITCNHVEKEKLRPRKGDGCTFSRLLVFEAGTRIEMHISRLLGDLFFHTNMVLDCLCLGGYKWATTFFYSHWLPHSIPTDPKIETHTYSHIHTNTQRPHRIKLKSYIQLVLLS